MPLRNVPLPIAEHISLFFGVHYHALEWEAYDLSGTRARHVAFIREHLGVTPFDESARLLLADTIRLAAYAKENSADIINIAIEELVRHRYELPGFTTLLNETKRGKADVNRRFYASVSQALGADRRRQLDDLLETDAPNKRSLWQTIKKDSGAPTLTHLRRLVSHLHWLKSFELGQPELFAAVPPAKVEHFALEAKSLDAARMIEMEPNKRYTLAAALVRRQSARCLDDLGEMLVKRMRKAHRHAQNALADYLLRHQSQTDRLIFLLLRILLALDAGCSEKERLDAIGNIVGGQVDEMIESCRTYSAYADNNYLPFLWRFCKAHRKVLDAILDEIELVSTTVDRSVVEALEFLRDHKMSKKEMLPLFIDKGDIPQQQDSAAKVSLDWIPNKWWKLVTGEDQRCTEVTKVDRRYFELCVFTELAHELQSGDVAIAGSNKFSDYRDELVSSEEYEAAIAEYCREAGLASDAVMLIHELQASLKAEATRADTTFPENDCLRIERGEPVLSRLEKRSEPDTLKLAERLLAERLDPINILDAIADTEQWLNWTRFFGPLSGHEAKVEEAVSRYLTTVFCYGCNLGPSQTARSMSDIDRRQIGWINQRHISEENLEEAITEVINGYNRFLLPSLWGSGESASADGTKWDLYEQNLLSEYHIRYGGYGGIGYYHVSDTYIALFSHFIRTSVETPGIYAGEETAATTQMLSKLRLNLWYYLATILKALLCGENTVSRVVHNPSGA